MFLFFLENHDGQGGIRYQERERVEQAVVLKMKYEPCFKEVNKTMVSEKKIKSDPIDYLYEELDLPSDI